MEEAGLAELTIGWMEKLEPEPRGATLLACRSTGECLPPGDR